MKQKTNDLTENIESIILGIILAFLFYNILGFALNTSAPLVTVVSCSMYPELNVGDLLVLKGITNVSQLKSNANGDIIVYLQEEKGKLIVHRVWDIKNETITTWGDNNKNKDPWEIGLDKIKGKKILRIPYLGIPKIILFNLITKRKMQKCEVLYNHRSELKT
ncbi:MAG: signal peptidase I [Candidatus Aenigmarchaeota archaeon ex4484_52]|nr:MAG: signal peptidase I [Candidatus Aenigmarchaeota archaeon ex4484_52]